MEINDNHKELEYVSITTSNGLEIEYLVASKPSPKGLIVLMPSALDPKREDRKKTVFLRKTWSELWPDYEVLVVADPALKQDERLNGAWFINPKVDVIAEIAGVVGRHANELHISKEKIVIYGSSLGGFGALGVATELGCKAIAEVPQVDFRHWIKSAQRQVEDYLIKKPVSEYALEFPHQISVLHRMLKVGRIPKFVIVTNPNDHCFKEQLQFFRWAMKTELPRDGLFELVLRSDVDGHNVLKKQVLCQLVERTIRD